MPYETIVYSRQRLYEEVWKEPGRDVAKRYGISDTALAKVCRKLNIPRPERGYWARFASGKKVTATPLRPLKLGEPAEHRVERWVAPPPPELSPEEIEFRSRPEFHAQRVELPFELVVPEVLEKPHPLISAAARGLRQSKPDGDGLVSSGTLPLHIGPEQVDRCLRFLDSLFKGLERAGHVVKAWQSYSEPARFIVGGHSIEFRVKERLIRFPNVAPKSEWFTPKWAHRPSGDLRFRIEWNWSWRSDRQWEENAHFQLNTHINVIFQTLLQIPEDQRAWNTERTARAQLEHKKAEQRREEEARLREEQQRMTSLVALAHRWKEANLVREFAAAMRQHAIERDGSIEPGSPTDRWLKFAENVATRIDPLNEVS